jgi:hypothetical protein
LPVSADAALERKRGAPRGSLHHEQERLARPEQQRAPLLALHRLREAASFQ